MKFTFKAKSSTGEPYNVDFSIESGKLFVQCNCKAGIFGQLCKHKTELISGDESRLFDISQNDKLKEFTTIISNVHEVQSLANNIVVSEKLIQHEQAKLKVVKDQFGKRLKEGIAILETFNDSKNN
ncbi:MAG: hypothetical protein EHM20_12410 [Alphaproteobacteria bacterium]|nr:MAG: hypothetical protein EHM20_12410 [Alphaproteobacteria bacterium]